MTINEQFDALEAKINARCDFLQRSIKQRFGKLNAKIKRAEKAKA